MKLSALTSITTRITVDLAGEPVWVDVRPQAVTTDAITAYTVASSNDDAAAVADLFPRLVCELVAAWDLQEDDGEMVPLTVERVRQLPLNATAIILREGMRGVMPGETMPETSVAG